MTYSNSNSNNEGIMVTGGSLIADQVVAGQNAHVIKTIYNTASDLENLGKREVADALTELIKALETHSGKIADEKEVLQAVQQVAEEVNKNEPNKITLKSLLDGIKGVVEPVTEVLQKVVALRGAIALLLGITL